MFYRIIVKPSLPQGARQEAHQKNNFRGEVFRSKSTASTARSLLEEPQDYVVVECTPEDGVILG